MNQTPETRTLRDYLRVLRQRWAWVVGIVVAAVGAALIYSVVKEPVYEATTSVNFRDESADLRATAIPVSPDFQPDKLAAANAKVVTSDQVIRRVQDSLNLDLSADELRSRVDTTVDPDSNLVEIAARDPKAEQAAALANTFARETQVVVTNQVRRSYDAAADRLRRQLQSVKDPTDKAAYRSAITRMITLSTLADPVSIARPADVPSSPASPRPLLDSFLAGLLGLLLGVGAAFIRDSFDRRVKDSHELQRQLGIPLVGYVREDALGRTVATDNGARGLSNEDLEAFRIIRTNVSFLVKEGELRSVAVTSAVAEEGKSTVAACFAYASALAGRRTLLVECDFRRPVLASRLGIESAPGLSEFLGAQATEVKPLDVVRAMPVKGSLSVDQLPVIPAGEAAYQPAEMLGSQQFRRFLTEVASQYELVVLDTAPILPVGDTLQLLPQVDAVLFCTRLGQATREQAQAARAALEHLPEKPIGLVATGVRPGSDDDYYGYYSHSPSAAQSTAGA